MLLPNFQTSRRRERKLPNRRPRNHEHWCTASRVVIEGIQPVPSHTPTAPSLALWSAGMMSDGVSSAGGLEQSQVQFLCNREALRFAYLVQVLSGLGVVLSGVEPAP